MKKTFCALLISLSISLTACVTTAGESASAQATDRLPLVKKNMHGEWRLDSSANWNGYTAILLERATVEFTKNWARDQRDRGNRPTEENMGRIKTEVSELLDEVFRQELTTDGVFTLGDTPAADVLRITPRIVDLNIYAPDRMRDHIGYSLADSKGSMTLVLEIHDSVSGALLAQMTENREDPRMGYFEWTTNGSNLQAARFMFMRWGNKLRAWLIEARTLARE
jgi:hypothetical protein